VTDEERRQWKGKEMDGKKENRKKVGMRGK
jgi:hypothetical protein